MCKLGGWGGGGGYFAMPVALLFCCTSVLCLTVRLPCFSGAWVLRATVSAVAEFGAVHPLQVARSSHLPQTQTNDDQGECMPNTLVITLKMMNVKSSYKQMEKSRHVPPRLGSFPSGAVETIL